MKKTKKQTESYTTEESLKERCARLRSEAESVNDDASAMFYTAMYQAVSLRIPETVKGAALVLLIDRKLAD
jgi:hypothetical protein